MGCVAYLLKLPRELEKIHDVFHVSMLRKYLAEPSRFIATENIEVRPDLNFDDEPVKILAHKVKILQSKQIPLIKVLWRNHKTSEATWETEEAIK
ncbi:Chromo domain-containing protein [Gossypium australe]|uniref:Chromo domain-containing protein n=1 Tax=Gossypium australe TaxID=47621 RepID=A0A5B6VM12_9ROSI|nr:Chromo domain-containing protein [Gossypium australe]